MKRYFIMLAVALVAIGCQKDNSESIIAGRYTDALSINLGTNEVRGSFNNELQWSWNADDEIIGYQNSGEKVRNTLSFAEGITFSCDKFTYATTEPVKFHFVYPASAEQNDKTLVASQDGTWNPILVGSTAETTLSEIGTVQMQHLTSALEVRSSGTEKITAISLTSPNEFLGCWTVKEDLSYEQNYVGNSLERSGLEITSYVINMPVFTAEELNAKDITLSVTTSGGVTTSNKLSGMSFEAGKRTIINICPPCTLLDKDKFMDKVDYLVNNTLGKNTITFITNSGETSGINVADASSTPIYLVENGGTLEFHTAARKIMAPEDSSELFSGLTTITSINFNGFDTSSVTNMYAMFFMSYALIELDLTNFDTSNVEDMSYMFYYCPTLTNINLSSFDFSNVDNYNSMLFYVGGSTKTDPVNCTVSVSAAGYTWATSKDLGTGNYEIVGPNVE